MIFKIHPKLLHCLNFLCQVANFSINCYLLHCLNFLGQVGNFRINCYLLHWLNICYQLVVLMLIHLLLDHLQLNLVFSLIIVLQCRTHIFEHFIILLLNFENSCSENQLFLFWRNFLSFLWMPCQVLGDRPKCLLHKFSHNGWLIWNYKQKQHMTLSRNVLPGILILFKWNC